MHSYFPFSVIVSVIFSLSSQAKTAHYSFSQPFNLLVCNEKNLITNALHAGNNFLLRALPVAFEVSLTCKRFGPLLVAPPISV